MGGGGKIFDGTHTHTHTLTRVTRRLYNAKFAPPKSQHRFQRPQGGCTLHMRFTTGRPRLSAVALPVLHCYSLGGSALHCLCRGVTACEIH